MGQIPCGDIRNFCIIAHIDHGKSTLADRFLAAAGLISADDKRAQIMDAMALERERGITIKAKAIRMEVERGGRRYALNLIDTPGHVDFTYEVSRALAACEGALLLIDASQGVEAQTIANHNLAVAAGLRIIPVINKIDLPTADVDGTRRQIKEILGIDEEPVSVSAKTGEGVETLIASVIENVPPPRARGTGAVALVFDSYYDSYRGVVIYVRIFSGTMRKGEEIKFMSNGRKYEVLEIGWWRLEFAARDRLHEGETGYVICGIKNIQDVRIGDTMTTIAEPASVALEGFREVKPFVFAGFYPSNPADYEDLVKALDKLRLTDASFRYIHETSAALGMGFRCGFLGTLHLEIMKERISREFGLDIIVTAPNVIYKVAVDEAGELKEYDIDNPSRFPQLSDIVDIREPMVTATIVVPDKYLGNVFKLLENYRARQEKIKFLESRRVILEYTIPLAEVIVGFYDALKSASSGHASFDYEHAGYQSGKLSKLEILINYEAVDAFSTITPIESAHRRGIALTERLKELIPRQMFEVPIQARIGSRIIARSTIPAMRKDVIAKCYGGDISRKRKLLEKQKEGKKKMKKFGRIDIPSETFFKVLKIN
ncbi:MAG: elongation factor 4 [Elusimicrobia bacterium HGW-Elusimicrobia-1]|jgi:GTP-binding protein LepA|nr:MAG: elongation factor 4 [Elusimicrobia bacterium HGW-Elusimicrobia-1]